jgi:hypothetical protein
MFDRVHADKKWFFLMRVTERYYLAPDEEQPHQVIGTRATSPSAYTLLHMDIKDGMLVATGGSWGSLDFGQWLTRWRHNAAAGIDWRGLWSGNG